MLYIPKLRLSGIGNYGVKESYVLHLDQRAPFCGGGGNTQKVQMSFLCHCGSVRAENGVEEVL